MSESASATPILSLTGLSKRYPGVLALDKLELSLMPGEVRALLGKNGAGKSTAIKILSGAIRPDQGTISVAGRRVTMANPLDAIAAGIATVYQEISLVPALSVAENLFLGRWPRGRGGLLDARRIREDARAHLTRLGIDLDPARPVGELSVAQQQLVEIAKAIAHEPQVLVLDEPTSALPLTQVYKLHDVVRRLSELGTAIIYVTHRLHEVPKIADSVSVLRDGRLVDTIPVSAATPERITALMIGEQWRGIRFERRRLSGTPVMRARNLCTPEKLRDVSFDLYPGEVLGLAGLLSSGRTELLRALFGLDPISAGYIDVAGAQIPRPSPLRMKRAGVGLTAEDRKRDGLILDFAVHTNATLAPIDRISRGGWLNFNAEHTLTLDAVRRLDIKTSSITERVGTLSGGNQQKIVVGNWLNTEPRVLLMDEPSRGVDVAAKEQIFRQIRALAADGLAVLFVSSEIEEVLDVCDRILVIHEGRITGSYDHDEIDLPTLVAQTMGEGDDVGSDTDSDMSNNMGSDLGGDMDTNGDTEPPV